MKKRLACLLLLLALPSQAFGCVVPDGADALRRTVAAEWNAERATAGRSALARERTLEKAAQDHACNMAERMAMSHIGSDGDDLRQRLGEVGYRFRSANENIGNFRAPDGAVKWWMSSAGHKANILSRDVIEFGIGVATGQDGRTYWVVVSGQRR